MSQSKDSQRNQEEQSGENENRGTLSSPFPSDGKESRRVQVKLSLKFLEQILRLPHNVEIVALLQDSDDLSRRTATLVITGDGLPDWAAVRLGEMPLDATLIFSQIERRVHDYELLEVSKDE